MDAPAPAKQRGRVKAGVVPVEVDFPEVGKEFRFENLLVINEAQNVIVNYMDRRTPGLSRCLR